ncbi:hypothetical protein SteCoe_9430 [Stentor coeruleus]|uniref:Uncharacterized protein n=1 Tax=Stentor coeruleus TaxID=5963 RepID=A0A1R2CHY9_9CILI|nr:hypothetical protein SteCoe_9430 [Stentor coeruleus]
METVDGKVDMVPDIIEEKKVVEVQSSDPIQSTEERKDPILETEEVKKIETLENVPKEDIKICEVKNVQLGNIEEGKDDSSNAILSPKIFVSLKSPGKDGCKKYPFNMEIADSLHERNLQKEAKISTMRLKKKADEIGKMQSVPRINPKSKKIIENSAKAGLEENESSESLKNENEDSFYKFIQETAGSPINSNTSGSRTLNKTKTLKQNDRQAGFTNSELIKSAVKLRESLPCKSSEPEKPVLDIVQKGELLKKKKAQKIKEADEKKKAQELDGCTFKPTLLTKSQTNESGSCVIHQSAGALKKKSSSGSTENKALTKHEFEESYELAQAKIYDSKYVPMSPVTFQVKYKAGYNENSILAKAQPMVDYRIVGNLLD